MDAEKQHEYLKAVNAFNLEHAAGLRLDFDELPELTQKILKEIKKEEGLTYDEAYAALECAYRYLKMESIFVPVYRE